MAKIDLATTHLLGGGEVVSWFCPFARKKATVDMRYFEGQWMQVAIRCQMALLSSTNLGQHNASLWECGHFACAQGE